MKHLHKLLLVLALVCSFAGRAHVTHLHGHSVLTISVSEAEANTCQFHATGNWTTAGSWQNCGGGIPTAADDVQIGTDATTGTLTVDCATGSATCLAKSVDNTGFTGTLTHANGKQLTIGTSTAGAFKLVSGETYNPGSSSLIKFVSTTTGNNITAAGKKFGNITFDGVGGGWQLQDNLDSVAGGGIITLTNSEGTVGLDTNGKTIGATNGFALSSSNSNPRALTLGATTWWLPASSPSWDITTPTGMTLSAGTSTIKNINPAGTTSLGFNSGGLTYNATLFTTSSFELYLLYSGAGTFATWSFTSGTSGTVTTSSLSANMTVTGTCTFHGGNSGAHRLYIFSDTKGTPRTISCGTTDLTNVSLKDITGAGSGSWNLSAISGSSSDCGGNSNITFTTPKNGYLKIGASANYSTAAWETASGGAVALSPVYPLGQDTGIIDANSITAGSVTLTLDNVASVSSCLGSMNWTGVTNSPTLAFTNASAEVGNVTLTTGMSVSGTGIMTLEGRGAQTFTTAGLALTPGILVSAPSGTYTQQDAFSSSNNTVNALAITNGTWAAGANNTTLTGATAKLNVNGGILSSSGTVNVSGATSANITVSSGTVNMASGILQETGASSTMTLSGGTVNVGTITRTGLALTVAGSTVNLGTGGAAYQTLTVSSGTLQPSTGNKIASETGTTLTVSAAASGGGGACTFGQNGNWPSLDAANDNYFPLRKAM